MRPLFYLLFLNQRGAVRRICSRLKEPRHLALWIVMAIVGLWMVVTVISTRQFVNASSVIGPFLPFIMLGFVLASFANPRANRQLFFSSAEVGFLFSGPFSPRHLLAYKILQSTKSAGGAALIFALWFSGLPGGYIGAVFVIWLSLMYLSGIGLGIRFLAELLSSKSRHLIAAALGSVLLVIGLWQAVATLNPTALMEAASNSQYQQIAGMIRGTWMGSVVLAPFEPFGHLLASGSPRELGRWSMVCLFLYVVLLTALFLVNFDFRDASIRTSGKLEKQLEKTQQGHLASMYSTERRPRLTLPMFPTMSGSGAILWRQLLIGFRGLRSTLTAFLIPVAIFCITLFFLGGLPASFGEGLAWTILGWMTIFLSGNAITCDFRGDIAHLDSIKALPMSPRAVVIGEIVPPTLLTWLVQLLAIAAFTLLSVVNPVHAILAAIVLIPINFLLFQAENLAVLLFPIHPSTSGSAELSARTMILFLVKAAIIGVAGLIGAGLGMAGAFLSGSIAVGVFAAAIVLAIICIAGISVLAKAFQRFDLSADTPSEEG